MAKTAEEEKARKKAYYEKNKEQVLARSRARHEANRDQINAKQRIYNASRSEEAKAEVAARAKAYYEKNKAHILAHNREYRVANREELAAQKRIYNEGHREEKNARARAWKRDNPHKLVAGDHRRRAAKLQATPIWATNVDQFVEGLALQRAPDHHVDHMVPLRGKKYSAHHVQLVCGLHAPDNLELISAEANLAKNCHTWSGMWDYTAEHMAELEVLWENIQRPPLQSAVRMKPYV